MNPEDKKLWLTEKKSECLLSDRRLTLSRLFFEAPDHRELGPYYNLKLGSYAVIVAMDEEGDYLCVRQFRPGIHQITTEFPAGCIHVDPSEESISIQTALRSAKRELLEETGYSSGHWTYLFDVAANSSLSDNRAFLFLATDCRKTARQDLDHTEYLEVRHCSPNELQTLIREGGFQHAIHILAWYLAKERMEKTEGIRE
jgi:ADP-ribose pyrophosphatase